MAKVITFSRAFPTCHPKAGQPTYFVEKIWKSLWDLDKFNEMSAYESIYNDVFPFTFSEQENIHTHKPKYHTIRGGNRFKAGEYFSPRVWSGRPYYSPQVIIAPDIQITNTHSFKASISKNYLLIQVDDWAFYEENMQMHTQAEALATMATNDGLSVLDFKGWFGITPDLKDMDFEGQIICWNPNLKY